MNFLLDSLVGFYCVVLWKKVLYDPHIGLACEASLLSLSQHCICDSIAVFDFSFFLGFFLLDFLLDFPVRSFRTSWEASLLAWLQGLVCDIIVGFDFFFSVPSGCFSSSPSKKKNVLKDPSDEASM